MSESEIEGLLRKFRDGACTPEEIEMLELWFDHESHRGEWKWESEEQRMDKRRQIHASIASSIADDRVQSGFRWGTAWKVAAAVAVVAFAGALYLFNNRPGSDIPEDFRTAAVAPGSNQAMLTLADGSSVLIDEALKGVVSEAGDSRVVKTAEGTLEYQGTGKDAVAKGRNTLVVPKGATFHVTLPDGTVVWLNSATKLTYFANNQDPERVVELSGEAYFEVSKDATRAFKVRTDQTEIQVTGTHFNVTSYPEDKQEATTLTEGQVIVLKGEQRVTLRPGQQAAGRDNAAMRVQEVDIRNVLAWKEGYFVFEDMDVSAIMQVIARWYDVEIEYQGEIPDKQIGGTFSKAKELSGLLTYLEQLSNIHFKQQGKKIMVSR